MTEIHKDCAMKTEWAKLESWMANHDEAHTHEKDEVSKAFTKYVSSQAEINTTHMATISKLMHRVYGNRENGLITTQKLNKQSAESEIVRIEEALKRLWWAFGIIAFALVGNFIRSLF